MTPKTPMDAVKEALVALKEPFRKKYWEAFFNGARYDEMLDQAWPWLVDQVTALLSEYAGTQGDVKKSFRQMLDTIIHARELRQCEVTPEIERHIERWEKEYAALRVAEPEWRDISTAPKDGAIVIGYVEDNGPCCMWWQMKPPNPEHIDGYWKYEMQWLEGSVPTHWIPLPPAPRKE